VEYIKSWALSLLTALGFTQSVVESQAQQKPLQIGSTKITIVQGDITQQTVDAIVNAANENLKHGGGVARAISKAAGPKLQIYCDKMPIIADGERCPMGKAVITPAFDLEKVGIKKIIHTTGPRGTTPNKETLLRDAYTNSLQVAVDNGLRSIAFPAISTAIFGYDINEATPVAFIAVRDFIKKYPKAFDEVRFVLFSDDDLAAYKKWTNELLK
jgi:O-acetyl-ADP-ribose deacetylase